MKILQVVGVHYYNPSTKKVENQLNQLKTCKLNLIEVEFNFTKKLEGRELKVGESVSYWKDEEGNEIETAQE